MFAGGIAGLIVASINGNNAGIVLTIGLAIAFASIALLAHSATRQREPIDAFDDVAMERLEQRIQLLVAAGAPESQVRELVRDVLRAKQR